MNFSAYECSFAQRRLFLLRQLDDDATTVYNLPRAMLVEGEFDLQRFEWAFQQLTTRHEGLRTCFELQNGEVIQKVYTEIEFHVEYSGMEGRSLDEIINQFIRPFDLSTPPLFRVQLVKIRERLHLFLFDIDHIITDGTSVRIITSEVMALYAGKTLPLVDVQYVDFVMWQNDLLQGPEIKLQEAYWLQTFAGEIPVLNLPTDFPRPSEMGHEGSNVRITVDEMTTTQMKEWAAKQGVTLFMFLLAIYNVVLAKYSGQEDIIIGSPSAGRQHAELMNTVGIFINNLPLRNAPAAQKTFSVFLQEVKQNVLQSMKHQDYQFEMLIDQLKLERDLSRNPLFDVLFIFQNTDNYEVAVDGLTITPYHFQSRTALVDLTIEGNTRNNCVNLDVQYRTRLFTEETITRFSTHFVNIIGEVLANPTMLIGEIEMVSPDEKNELIYGFNQTLRILPENKTIVMLFEEQVAKTPNACAVICNGQSLTYRELNDRANQLGHLLRARGARRDGIVGIMVERSFEMIIGVLAIMKAGAAYLPIDPDYPQERIEYMLEDSRAAIFLAQEHLMGAIQYEGNQVIFTDALYIGNAENLPLCNEPTDLAYIIYTSGSTGRPKAVMIQHDHYVNAAYGWREAYRLDQLPVNLLQMASFSFDVFAGDVARTLLNGGRMVICPGDLRVDYPNLYTLMVEYAINMFEATPSVIIPFMEYVYQHQLSVDHLELLILGSDSCPMEEFKRLLARYGDKMRIINSYGASEATIDTSFYEERLEKITGTGNVPIGKPLPNMQLYVLDERLKPKPIGVPGDLYIGGKSVARGYYQRPELTAERFLENPYVPGERLYKTGDLGKWLPDGNMQFLGRSDHQVKIRGYRIELGEIEEQLLKMPGIHEAVVIDRFTPDGEKYLCGYVVADRECTVAELKAYLAKTLPDYMIPSHFIQLSELPLTPNGKVDRKGLPVEMGALGSGVSYVAPHNPVEEKLVTIWSEILHQPVVGVEDNFFDLGGHSLLAIKMIFRVNEEFGMTLTLKDIFLATTVEAFARRLEEVKNARLLENQPQSAGLIRPFDLKQIPLMRANVVKLAEKQHLLFIDMHHIVTDGVSMNRLIDEFKSLYRGETLDLPMFQYKDYAEWQEHYFASDRYRKQEQYWLNLYNNKLPELRLPLDYPRLPTREIKGERMCIDIHQETLARLKQSAAREGVTLYMYLLTVYELLLYRLTGQNDLVIGTPVSGRTHANVAEVIGMFVNTLALRTVLTAEWSFHELLQRVKETVLEAFENQEYPFEMLIEKLNLQRETHRNPLFDTMFTLQNMLVEDPRSGIEGLKVKPYDFEFTGSQFDLTVAATVSEDGLRIWFHYDTSLWKWETVQEMVDEYKRILTGVLERPERPIMDWCQQNEVELLHWQDDILVEMAVAKEQVDDEDFEQYSAPELPAVEKQQVLYMFNETVFDFPQGKLVYHFFEEQADRTPERIAVIYGNYEWTYRELNIRANMIAHQLLARGVCRGEIVGIMVERSWEMMAGLLGIWKAGGAYLPIDPHHADRRIQFILEDAGVRVLLTQSHLQRETLDLTGKQVLALDRLDDQLRAYANPCVAVGGTDLAYVIYTSGSTGQPKGVLVEHHALVNRLIWVQANFPLTADDTVLQKTIYTFDGSQLELFSWFMGGGRICFLEAGAERDLQMILHTIEEKQITATFFVPTLLKSFLQGLEEGVGEQLRSLKWIYVGGEQLEFELVEQFNAIASHAKLINIYGPTETVIFVTCYTCTPTPDVSSIPIGKPLGNSRVYILDRERRPVPVGAVGELYLAGESLARGYLNRPELTNATFLPDPFSPGERMYKSGDLGMWLPDGNIAFVGRVDQQIKLRGFRIELGEIEVTLAKHPAIQHVAVVKRRDVSGEQSLVAYLVADEELQVRELREYLLETLPDYMVPAYFVRLDTMPLTTSGKIDRRALPEMIMPLDMGNPYVSPRNDSERVLADLWSTILKWARVGIEDNFFELGGDSLKANQVIMQVNKLFGIDLSVKEMFTAPTVRGLMERIIHSQQTVHQPITPAKKKAFYATTSSQKRQYVLHEMDPMDLSYNVPCVAILEGELDRLCLQRVLQTLVERHESLRTSFNVVNGEVVQYIHDKVRLDVEFYRTQETNVDRILRGEAFLQKESEAMEDNSFATITLEKKGRRKREV